MNPLKLFKAYETVNKILNTFKENSPVGTKIVQLLHLSTTLFGIFGVPDLLPKYYSHHVVLVEGLVAFSTLLHFLSPSIFGGPTEAASKVINIKTPLIILLMFFIGTTTLHAQTATPPTTAATDLSQFFAGGVSYNVGGSPALAGTGLYAHSVSASNTFTFTAVDAVPNTLKPFTVSTNMGIGVAQQVFTIGKFPVFTPAAAGISFTGANTGWQWNAGAIMPIKLSSKNNYYIVPMIRLLKSSVSNGTGYQPIIGLLFGWGN